MAKDVEVTFKHDPIENRWSIERTPKPASSPPPQDVGSQVVENLRKQQPTHLSPAKRFISWLNGK